jgi:hypothetical protein
MLFKSSAAAPSNETRIAQAPVAERPVALPPETGAPQMPITPYLNGEHFDPESMCLLGVAFSLICVSLQVEGSDDDVKQAIANKVIEFAKAGTRNPDLLCERVLEDIRRPPEV